MFLVLCNQGRKHTNRIFVGIFQKYFCVKILLYVKIFFFFNIFACVLSKFRSRKNIKKKDIFFGNSDYSVHGVTSVPNRNFNSSKKTLHFEIVQKQTQIF